VDIRIVLAIVLVVLLIASAVAHREYQAAYARRHGDVPPLLAPFTRSDPDPDVEWFRRRELVLSAGIVLVGIVLAVLLPGPS
jgi:hypothetical protein